jgi:hypothetical protein
MVVASPDSDFVDKLINLTRAYRTVSPQFRYNTIRKRLAQEEIGATKLITVVSAVEGLARSIAVHNKAATEALVAALYLKYRYRSPVALVEEVFKFYCADPPPVYFQDDTWKHFRHAVDYRNLVVHECTYLGQDNYLPLIGAAFKILEVLVKLAALKDN